jgi:hypothetical protein|tara:strand:- start:826 stop:1041 length:216 start_codon:yes stop_codon:yes gene_type:complete
MIVPFYGMTNKQIEIVLNNINTQKQKQKEQEQNQIKEKERLQLMKSIVTSNNPLSFSNLMLYSTLYNQTNN